MKSDGVDIALNPSVLDFVEDIKTLEQACLAVARHLFVALIEALDDALLAQNPNTTNAWVRGVGRFPH